MGLMAAPTQAPGKPQFCQDTRLPLTSSVSLGAPICGDGGRDHTVENKCPCEGRSWRGNHSLQASWTHYSSTHRWSPSLGAGPRISPKRLPPLPASPVRPLPPVPRHAHSFLAALKGRRKTARAPKACASQVSHIPQTSDG